MGALVLCCCGLCETSNSKSTLGFAIASGLHPQSISKQIRNLKDSSLFSTPCLKVSCASPDTAIGTDEPIVLPCSLRASDCCGSFGIVTALGEGASTPLYNSRDFSFTISTHTSGVSPNECPPFGDLPWEINSEYYVHRFSTMVAKRIIDSVHVRICPSTGPYGAPTWTVTADVCWRVVYRTRESVESDTEVDVWAQLTDFNIFTGVCNDPTIKKHCGIACHYTPMLGGRPLVVGSGSADLSTSCLITTHGSGYESTPLTTIGEPCTNTLINGPDNFYDYTYVHTGTQRRVITIARDTCELPATLGFPYSALSGANGDITVGWVDPGGTVLCDWQAGTRVYTGDRSSFTLYAAMTELWTISLS